MPGQQTWQSNVCITLQTVDFTLLYFKERKTEMVRKRERERENKKDAMCYYSECVLESTAPLSVSVK